MEKLERIKEYIIGAMATIGSPISESDKIKEIDRLLMECLEKEIDTILNVQQQVKNLNIPAVICSYLKICPRCKSEFTSTCIDNDEICDKCCDEINDGRRNEIWVDGNLIG
jgi:hypothetical protein